MAEPEPEPSPVDGGWRTLWRYDHDHVTVAAGAIAVLPGDPSTVVVTEEWPVNGLSKCDNTEVYRLTDGTKESPSIMFAWPFETPRIEVSTVGDAYVSVVNTSRGVFLWPATPPGVEWPVRMEGGRDGLGSVDWRASDLVTGRHGDQAVVAAVWDVPAPSDDTGLHLQAYDLATGAPIAKRWRLPSWSADDWNFPEHWRLGRWDGRPVAAMFDGTWLPVACAVTGELEAQIVLAEVRFGPDRLGLLAIDDRAGPTLALIDQDDRSVCCLDLATDAAYCPPLADYPGTLTGARLGRWRDRPVAALLTSTGVSLYDLSAQRWICHIGLQAAAYDVAFVVPNQLAIVSATGPMVVEVTGWNRSPPSPITMKSASMT